MRVSAKSMAMAVLMCAAGGLAADEQAEATIAYRQSLFKAVVWNFRPMNEMARGNRPYDADEVKKRSLAVSYLSTLLGEAFAQGSGPSGGTTDALDEIWKTPEDFAVKLKAFQVEANALRKIAAQGKQESFVAQFRKVGTACKDCHENYRAD